MKMADVSLGAQASALEFDDEEIRRRKAFLEFDASDAAHLHRFHDVLKQHAGEFARTFYYHLHAFEGTRRLLPNAAGSAPSPVLPGFFAPFSCRWAQDRRIFPYATFGHIRLSRRVRL
jgi:hypothetical protein